MGQFRMKIAGQVGDVSTLFQSTADYFEHYLTEEDAHFSVTVRREDLAAEQAFLAEEARQEGLKTRKFPEPFLERAVIQRRFAEHLFTCGTLLFHGSTVAMDGRAWVFTAKCGTGKSTHTRLWRQVFGDRAVMVNDDKPFLRFTEDGILACGSPWSGKHGLDANISVPLGGICILERGPENRIRRITPAEALPRLLHESFCPEGQEERLQALVTALAERTPLWRMECNKDPQAALTAHGAMSGT